MERIIFPFPVLIATHACLASITPILFSPIHIMLLLASNWNTISGIASSCAMTSLMARSASRTVTSSPRLPLVRPYFCFTFHGDKTAASPNSKPISVHGFFNAASFISCRMFFPVRVEIIGKSVPDITTSTSITPSESARRFSSFSRFSSRITNLKLHTMGSNPIVNDLRSS